MALTTRHGHKALRRGRWSMPGVGYFLTFCTQDRKGGLVNQVVVTAIMKEAARLETEGVWHIRTLVVMPDHLHLLIVMGDSSDLKEAIRLFKGRLTPVLRKVDLQWQKAYFDHRVRTEEDVLPIFLYVFLNPYRANLVPQNQEWPGYYCAREDWVWFEVLTKQSCPFPEWLA